MKEKKEVIILAEEHPSNLRTLASFGLNSAREEIEEFSKNLIKVFIETYIRKKEIYTYVKGIEDAVETMESSGVLYLKQQDIKLLDSFLNVLPKDSTKLYVEGSRETFRKKPRYKKLEDENGNPLKNSS